jgi:hypothetical protein
MIFIIKIKNVYYIYIYMNPEVWGPCLWKFLHINSLNYPNNPTHMEQMYHLNFFISLGNIIPCDKCKYHYNEYINQIPPNLTNRNNLIMWLHNFHNAVNKRLGKKTYTLEEGMILIKQSIEGSSNKVSNLKSNSSFSVILLIIFIISLTILLYIIFNRIKNKRL